MVRCSRGEGGGRHGEAEEEAADQGELLLLVWEAGVILEEDRRTSHLARDAGVGGSLWWGGETRSVLTGGTVLGGAQVEKVVKEAEEKRRQREMRMDYVKQQHAKKLAEREKERREAEKFFKPEVRAESSTC